MDSYTSGRLSKVNTWVHTAPLSIWTQDQTCTHYVPAGTGLVISQSLPTTATPGGLERDKNMEQEINELIEIAEELNATLDKILKRLEDSNQEVQALIDKVLKPNA